MNPEARFRDLFEAHYPGVARYVLARGFRSADADDLIAATFEVAWRRLDRVPPGEGTLPWLLAVTRNLARNEARRATRERLFQQRLSGITAPADEGSAAGRAEWEVVRTALAQLRPCDRDLILLVAWDELSLNQAAQVLGLLPVTARSRLHRARRRLAALLDQSGNETSQAPARTRAHSARPKTEEETDA
ncbi:MAG TPA: sigma-70 family RNA polymerase sigma factor [Solirubrobacteraceae bacterium]|nr:sigma-70 family RNA polymerase sigma factor [Solirubrobacteraceae bacterium]